MIYIIYHLGELCYAYKITWLVLRCFDKYRGDGNVNVPWEYVTCYIQKRKRLRHEYSFTFKYDSISWKNRRGLILLTIQYCTRCMYVKIKATSNICNSAFATLIMYFTMKLN